MMCVMSERTWTALIINTNVPFQIVLVYIIGMVYSGVYTLGNCHVHLQLA